MDKRLRSVKGKYVTLLGNQFKVITNTGSYTNTTVMVVYNIKLIGRTTLLHVLLYFHVLA